MLDPESCKLLVNRANDKTLKQSLCFLLRSFSISLHNFFTASLQHIFSTHHFNTSCQDFFSALRVLTTLLLTSSQHFIDASLRDSTSLHHLFPTLLWNTSFQHFAHLLTRLHLYKTHLRSTIYLLDGRCHLAHKGWSILASMNRFRTDQMKHDAGWQINIQASETLAPLAHIPHHWTQPTSNNFGGVKVSIANCKSINGSKGVRRPAHTKPGGSK